MDDDVVTYDTTLHGMFEEQDWRDRGVHGRRGRNYKSMFVIKSDTEALPLYCQRRGRSLTTAYRARTSGLDSILNQADVVASW